MKHYTRLFCASLVLLLCSMQSLAQLQAAPDFTLKTRDDSTIKLSEQQGNVVMLNFWASWCGPCRKEMPLLEKIQQKYARLGFVLIGMNVDEDTSAAERFLQDVPVSFPIALDSKGEISKLYNVKAMPTTVMIDRSGKIRNIHYGYKDGDEKVYEQMIRELVRE